MYRIYLSLPDCNHNKRKNNKYFEGKKIKREMERRTMINAYSFFFSFIVWRHQMRISKPKHNLFGTQHRNINTVVCHWGYFVEFNVGVVLHLVDWLATWLPHTCQKRLDWCNSAHLKETHPKSDALVKKHK